MHPEACVDHRVADVAAHAAGAHRVIHGGRTGAKISQYLRRVHGRKIGRNGFLDQGIDSAGAHNGLDECAAEDDVILIFAGRQIVGRDSRRLAKIRAANIDSTHARRTGGLKSTDKIPEMHRLRFAAEPNRRWHR